MNINRRESILALLGAIFGFGASSKAGSSRIPGLPDLPRCIGPFCERAAKADGNLEQIEKEYRALTRGYTEEFAKHGIKVRFVRRQDSNEFTPCNADGYLVVYQTIADEHIFQIYSENNPP